MIPFPYSKSNRYADLSAIYTECSGPGGLHLTEAKPASSSKMAGVG